VPYGAGPGAYGVPVTGAAGNDQMAVWSLVLGIAGVPLSCCCYIGVPMLIAAIPLGIVSRNRIRASNGALEGEGMALAGAIVGAVGLAVVVALFLLNTAVSISDWTVG
jgi:hypothetical protein